MKNKTQFVYVLYVLCGKDWIRTATVETQEQADAWVSKFEKIGQSARWELENDSHH